MATVQEENYHLKWHSFNKHLHSTVAKSFRNECFADVALLTMDGSQLMAHRFVLSASSQYFQQVFRLHAKHFTTLPLMVVLPAEIKHPVLQILIQFMYCGEAVLPQQCMEDVMKAAELLKIKGLHRPKRKISAENKSASPRIVDTSNGHESDDCVILTERKNVYSPSPVKEAKKSSKTYYTVAEKPTTDKEKPKPTVIHQQNQPPQQKVLNYSIPVGDHSSPIKESSNSKKVILPTCTKKVDENDDEDNYYLFEDCDVDSDDYEADKGSKKEKCSKRQDKDKDENQLYVTLTCDTCDEDFAEPADWVEHVQTAHGNSDDVSCQKRKRLKQ